MKLRAAAAIREARQAGHSKWEILHMVIEPAPSCRPWGALRHLSNI